MTKSMTTNAKPMGTLTAVTQQLMSITEAALCPTLRVIRILPKESGACVLLGEKGARAVIRRDDYEFMESRLSPGCVVALKDEEGWMLPVVQGVIEVGDAYEPEMIHPDDTRNHRKALEEAEIMKQYTKAMVDGVEQLQRHMLSLASALTAHTATLRQMG